MISKSSLLISSLVFTATLAACSSAEKRNLEQQVNAASDEKSRQEATVQAQKDAETRLFTQLKPEELRGLVQDGVVFGYPLVVMDASRQLNTNPASPGANRGEINQFNHTRNIPEPGYRDGLSPSVDSLSSTAWVDLGKEPLILEVPSVGNRFYTMRIQDAWMNVIASPGTRTTGSAAEEFALVGPNWEGQLPANVRKIQSPTNLVLIIGTTRTTGKKDLDVVHAIQNRYRLMPLSQFNRNYAGSKTAIVAQNEAEGTIQWRNTANEMVTAMDAKAFFTRLSRLMVDNPPAPADRPMMAKLEKIGVTPGKTVDFGRLPEEVRKDLDEAVRGGYQRVEALATNAPGRMANGWVIHENTGNYGTDYDRRAGVALMGMGLGLPQDAIAPIAHVDSTGARLTGANKYVMHFRKDNLPPVNGFWSLTAYDSKQSLVANRLNRYALTDRDKLKVNKDGSVNIYIQEANPGKDKVANWLPTPRGEFSMMMRLYWPKQTVLNGEWQIPGVQKVRPQMRLTQRTAKRITRR